MFKTIALWFIVTMPFVTTMAQSGLGQEPLGITGPECVRTGVEYQYIISGSLDSVPGLHIVLTGGVFTHNGLTRIDDSVVTEVRVTWTDSTGGSVSIGSATDSITKFVSVAPDLLPGTIDSAQILQVVNPDSIPATIVCSPANGGGCSASYEYQWQQSADGIEWTDVPGADGINLNFSATLSETTFYRRRVKPVLSDVIAYSNVAVVVRQ